MNGPVRQHHTLATTGKLGQGGGSAKPAPRPSGGGSKSSKSGGYGSQKGKSSGY